MSRDFIIDDRFSSFVIFYFANINNVSSPTITELTLILIQSIVSLIISITLADTASGILHWIFETYGSKTTLILGPTIHSFRIHHDQPYRIWHRSFFSVNHELSRLMLLPQIIFSLTFNYDTSDNLFYYLLIQPFIILFAFCNQFHKWSHTPAPNHLPFIIKFLQKYGIILSISHHKGHHIFPHKRRYCIINGWSDYILDTIYFWRILELGIFFIHHYIYYIAVIAYIAANISQITNIYGDGIKREME